MSGDNPKARAIGNVGKALGNAGDLLQAVQVEKERQYIAEAEQAMEKARAELEVDLVKNFEPETFKDKATNRFDSVREHLLNDERFSGRFRDQLARRLDHFQQGALAEVERKAAVQTIRKGHELQSQRFANYIANERFDDARRVLHENRGVYWGDDQVEIGEMRVVEAEKEKAIATTYSSIVREIESDPLEAEEQLFATNFAERYPDLGEQKIDQLRRHAHREANRTRAELWDGIMNAALDEGDSHAILGREELKEMAEAGMITPEQRARYLRAYHGPAEPSFDPALYERAFEAIQSFDPTNDPTGAGRASLLSELGTLPLPKEHVAELKSRLEDRLNPTDGAKHHLAADFSKVTSNYFEAGRFGDWFTYGDHDSNAATPNRKVIDLEGYSQAIATRRKFTEAWDSYLREAPADLKATEARQAFEQLFNTIVLDGDQFDLMPMLPAIPPPVDFNRDLDRILGPQESMVLPPNQNRDTSMALPPGLAPYRSAFEEAGQLYGVDPRLLAAISRHETANGTSSAFRSKRNAMGVSNAVGPISFHRVEDSILRMAKLLGSTDSGPYKDAKSLAQVGRIYAPVGAGNDPRGLNQHWFAGVSKYYQQLGGDPEGDFRQMPGRPELRNRSWDDVWQNWFSDRRPTDTHQIDTALSALLDEFALANHPED